MKIYTKEIIKKRKEKRKKMMKYVYIISKPIIALIMILCIYIAYQRLILKKQNVDVLGYKMYIVMTGSMEPAINTGDLIIGKVPSESNIKEGDIVTFYSKGKSASVTHRIIEQIEKDGKIYYKTKGDNNNSVDPDLVKFEDMQAIVSFRIAKVGKLIMNTLTGTGLICVFCILVICYNISSKKEDRILAREEARRRYNVCKYKNIVCERDEIL